MFCAGVDWSERGYGVTVVNQAGLALATIEVGPEVAEIRRLIGTLLATAQPGNECLALFVDSSNGAVADLLTEAGLPVYRVDPPLLGSPPSTAAALAGVGHRAFARATAIGTRSGFLTGRMRELIARANESATVEVDLSGDGRFLSHGDRRHRQVALTFDDGPHPPYTNQILGILREFSARATFYCVGLRLAAYPELARRILAEGHALGNHSWSHAFLPDLSDTDLETQVRLTARHSQAATGVTPSSFRPPYGGRAPGTLRALAALGQVIVTWDVDSRDWTRPGAGLITERVLSKTRSGAIILLHDGGGDRSQTVAALPRLIEGLRERGYTLVTVDEFAAAAS